MQNAHFLCRWINCLIMAIQKHKKFNPDSEEGEKLLKSHVYDTVGLPNSNLIQG